jgi:DNA-binding NtrC family response regulator
MALQTAANILVVDDQPNWRLALRTLLESEGFAVKQASSFEEAEALVAVSTFDVAVLDIRLADEITYNVEGLELLRVIKKNCPHTRVIILTGYPESLKEEPEADILVLKVPEGSTFDSGDFKMQVRKLVNESIADRSGRL